MLNLLCAQYDGTFTVCPKEDNSGNSSRFCCGTCRAAAKGVLRQSTNPMAMAIMLVPKAVAIKGKPVQKVKAIWKLAPKAKLVITGIRRMLLLEMPLPVH